MIGELDYSKLTDEDNKIRFWVQDWLTQAKICKRCCTLMKFSSVGGMKNSDGQDNAALMSTAAPEEFKEFQKKKHYTEYRCPQCGLVMREEKEVSFR